MHLRGWQERDISCIGPGGYAVSDLHCIHKPKPIKRQRCIHRDCHVIWSTSVWSAVSRNVFLSIPFSVERESGNKVMRGERFLCSFCCFNLLLTANKKV